MISGSFTGGFDSLLEGAAALFVLYWLMASACSFLAEIVSSVLNTRGNALRQFAIDMVQGEVRGKATPWIGHGPGPAWNLFCGWISKRINLDSVWVTGFAASLFSHNLMKSLEQPKLFRSGANTAPAYVPSQMFAQTVVDRLLNVASFRHFASLGVVPAGLGEAATDALRHKLLAIADAVDAEAAGLDLPPGAMARFVLDTALAHIETSPFVTDFVDAVGAAFGGASPFAPGAAAPNPSGPAAIIAARFFGGGAAGALATMPARQPASVAAIGDALKRPDVPLPLKQALRPIIDAANHDFDALTNGIAVWYDASMARASGWYKRYSLFVLAILGFGLAIVFNIDTPRIIGALIESPGLRAAGYAAAVGVVGQADSTARQAIPQQVAFIRAADRLCGKPAASATPANGETPCPIDDDKYRRLLPLTLTSGANSQVLMYLESNRLAPDAPRFATMMKAYCVTPNSCSKNADGKVDAATVASVINDPFVFWNSGLARCRYLVEPKTASTAPVDCGKAIDSARTSAMVTAGAVSSYIDAVTGIDQGGGVNRNAPWYAANSITSVVSHLFGWLVTGLMVSFGAPFWFDLLQQIVNRRGAGPKPAEAVPTDLS